MNLAVIEQLKRTDKQTFFIAIHGGLATIHSGTQH